MVRKEIGSIFDRINRNNMNDNFEYLFEGRQKIDELNYRAEGILNKANETNDMNKNVQSQINTLIAESGTSDAEVLQARIDKDGKDYTVLKERLDTDQLTLDGIKQTSIIQDVHASKIKSLIDNGEEFKLAILGDSTKAGVGWRFSSPFSSDTHGYGELADISMPVSQEQWMLGLIFNSPRMIKPQEYLSETNLLPKGDTSIRISGTLYDYDRYLFANGVSGISEKTDTYTFNHLEDKSDTMVIYYLARSTIASLLMDATSSVEKVVLNGRAEPGVFNGKQVLQSGWALKSTKIKIPTTGDTFTIKVDNLRDSEGDSSREGTLNIVGFLYGEEVSFKNLSIRSTTIENESDRNKSMGVTTDERIQAALDYGANAFYIGWGTNDAGLSANTPKIIAGWMEERIVQIQNAVNDPIIILDTAYPRFTSGGVDLTTELWNEYKKLAYKYKTSLIDGASILSEYPEAEVINDFVHQSKYGYKVLGSAIERLFNIQLKESMVNHFINKDYIKESSGTFTPRFDDARITFKRNNGAYFKTGKLVCATIDIEIDTVPSDLSGATVIAGLPFPAISGDFRFPFNYSLKAYFEPAGARKEIVGVVNSGASTIRFYDVGGGYGYTTNQKTSLKSNTRIQGAVYYYID